MSKIIYWKKSNYISLSHFSKLKFNKFESMFRELLWDQCEYDLSGEVIVLLACTLSNDFLNSNIYVYVDIIDIFIVLIY